MSKAGQSVQIPEDVNRALTRAAKERRTSRVAVVVEALREHLGIHAQDEIDRACEEINEADAQDPDLQALMEDVFEENMFENERA